MKVLLFGRDGQVGRALVDALAPKVNLHSLGRRDVDFTEPARVTALLRNAQPDIVINAVAHTAVDKAEVERELAHLVNAYTPAMIGRSAAECGAWLIHYSTDYVFDGEKDGPYTEEDPTAPLNVYGTTKRDGEIGIAESGARHLIFRLGWIHSTGANNFISKILRRAQALDEFDVVEDQIGAPTSARLIAHVTARALLEIEHGRLEDSGVYHLVAAGETSWNDYARFVIDEAHKRGIPVRATPDRIRRVPSSSSPGVARRPRNSRLSTEKLRAQLKIDLPDWQGGVRQTMADLAPEFVR